MAWTAEYAGKNCLIIVDYLSKLFNIIQIKNKSTEEIISTLVVTFVTQSIPKIVVCDNNNPFRKLEK